MSLELNLCYSQWNTHEEVKWRKKSSRTGVLITSTEKIEQRPTVTSRLNTSETAPESLHWWEKKEARGQNTITGGTSANDSILP